MGYTSITKCWHSQVDRLRLKDKLVLICDLYQCWGLSAFCSGIWWEKTSDRANR